MKIVQTLEDSNILLKRVTKTNKNETKKLKGGFLGMLLGHLGASLLRNMLAGTGMFRVGPSHSLTDLKFKIIIKMNPDLMEFFQEITYLI